MRQSALILPLAALFVGCGPSDASLYKAQPGCDGLHAFCLGGGLCCSGMFCGFDSCCIGAGNPCGSGKDCCSGSCQNGVCDLSGIGGWCDDQRQCKPELECEIGVDFCEVPAGGHCRSANDCITNTCLSGTCGCGSAGNACQTAADCCSGQCVNSGTFDGNQLGNACH